MTYFKPVTFDEEKIYIPHVDGSYCSFKFKEGEDWGDFLENAGHRIYKSANGRICYGAFNKVTIWTKPEDDEGEKDPDLNFFSYGVEDLSEEKLFIISLGEIEHQCFENPDLVCVPQHYFNIFKFIKENFLPFEGADIVFS